MMAMMEDKYSACPGNDVKIVMGEANVKIGWETIHHPTISKYSLHESTNENGLRLIDFATGRQMVIKSTYFMHNRINTYKPGTLPNGRTFNVIDVKGANIDSDHILVVITLRVKICRAFTTRQEQQRRSIAVERLNSKDLVTQYHNELEPES
jgi:hypothetical protein